VNDLFSEQNELLPYKSAYKKDDHRKIRDKYKSELKKAKADSDTGNQSGKSGELSQKYQLVQHILTEMDSEEEERKEKKKDKEVLNTIEGQLQYNKMRNHVLRFIPHLHLSANCFSKRRKETIVIPPL
jgi:hypothetical protein